MKRFRSAAITGLLFLLLASTGAFADNPVVVTVPARAGAVEGSTQNSDAFIWRLLTLFAAPVLKTQRAPAMFETWASDSDTF